MASEAENFAVSVEAGSEADLQLQKIEKQLAARADWRRLEMSSEDLRRLYRQKLTAKNFIRLKTESMTGVISDAEAQAYFEKNRVKFGTLPFASFKDNIKSFLTQQQLEERLRSWFEIIRRKSRVREFQGVETNGKSAG